MESRTLLEVFPRLADRVPWARLASLPTPLEPLPGVPGVMVKRDDLTSATYGGNKVRTLEVLFGVAKARGCDILYATGAYGSNHAVATALHAPRVGLEAGAILFPQPPSPTAVDNLRVTLATCRHRVLLPHWSVLPVGMARARRGRGWLVGATGARTAVMVPGGATPWGALGYVSAAFELLQQLAQLGDPPLDEVVLPVGSTCTSAGLLLGLHYGHALGLTRQRPRLRAVRVTPWPITARARVLDLAVRASRLVSELAGQPELRVERGALAPRVTVDGTQLGRGYGYDTPRGVAASADLVARLGLHPDPIYMGKAAAMLQSGRSQGETVFWVTKSSAPLPFVQLPPELPKRVLRWIARATEPGLGVDSLPR